MNSVPLCGISSAQTAACGNAAFIGWAESHPHATFCRPGGGGGLVVVKANPSSPQALGGSSVTDFATIPVSKDAAISLIKEDEV